MADDCRGRCPYGLLGACYSGDCPESSSDCMVFMRLASSGHDSLMINPGSPNSKDMSIHRIYNSSKPFAASVIGKDLASRAVEMSEREKRFRRVYGV